MEIRKNCFQRLTFKRKFFNQNYCVFQSWGKSFRKQKWRTKINNPSITALYHFCPNFIDFNGTKTTTIQTWRALVQTSKLGLIDLNPSSNAARKIIYFVYKAVLMILQLLPVVSRWQMLVVRVKRFIYQNIRTISISESQKPTNILQKSAHSSQCTLFVKRLNESLGGCCCLMSLTLGDFLGSVV